MSLYILLNVVITESAEFVDNEGIGRVAACCDLVCK